MKSNSLKQSSLAEFMTYHAMKKPFFSCSAPLPLRIKEYQRKGGTEIEQDIAGASQVQKSLHAPCSLFAENAFSLEGLPTKYRLRQLLIREVRECKNKGKANSSVRKQSPSSSKDIPNNLMHIFEFFCRN